MAVGITKPSSQVGNTANVAVYSMAPSFVPTALAKLLVFAHASGTATGSISGGGGLSWDTLASFDPQALGNSARLFATDAPTSPGTASLNIDYTGDNATGCCAAAIQITGQEPYIRQVVQVASVGANPVVTFPLAVDSRNAVAVGLFLGSGLGIVTAPQSWTTIAASYATPTTGLVAAYRPGGATGATFTFSSGAASGLAYIAVEVWAQGAVPPGDPFGMSGFFGA